MYKPFLSLLLLILLLEMSSCKSKITYNGDSMINYPDMGMILQDNLEPYEKAPYTYRLVTVENNKKDTSYLHANEVKWKTIKQPFLDASLYNKELDRQYKIDVITDTITSTLTMIYTSLNPENLTSNLSIKANLADNKVKSIYAETRDAGFFSSTEYKLLLVNQKTIQIQELSKKPFSSLKQKVTTLTFLN